MTSASQRARGYTSLVKIANKYYVRIHTYVFTDQCATADMIEGAAAVCAADCSDNGADEMDPRGRFTPRL